MNFVDRIISGALIFVFVTPVTATIQDLHLEPGTAPKPQELQAMGACGAKIGAYFGAGFAVGPFIGSLVGGQGAFALSMCFFAATTAYVQRNVGESLPESQRKPFDIAAVSPFSFVKLFKTQAMTTLSGVLALSSFAEYSNISDLNFLYMKTVMNWGQQQIGRFAALFGVTQMAGGILSNKIMKAIGQDTYTKLGFASYMIGFASLGSARSVRNFGLALFFLMFGHQRNAEISTHLGVHATAAGMGKGEVAAASSNLTAMLKLIAPLMYSRVFAFNTSGGRNRPGSPYFLICAFLLAAQAVLMTYDRKSLPQK